MVHVLIEGDYMWIRKDTVTFHLNSVKIMMMTCFCGMVDRRKVLPYFQPCPVSEIPTIANLWHPVSRVWACAEPELRPWWMRLCSSDNQYTTVQLYRRNVKTPRQCKSLKNTILSFLNVNSACWSRDMLNFDFLEKVFSPSYTWTKKDIFMLYSNKWPNIVIWFFYFLKYWAICVLLLFVLQFVTS